LKLLRERGLKLAVSYNGPEDQSFAERFRHDDVIVTRIAETDLDTLLARLDRPTGEIPPDFGDLSRAEAQRLIEASGADVVLAFVTHDAGTGITAMTRTGHRTRGYRFGGAGVEAPVWASMWAISMAWHLLRQVDRR